MGQGPSSERNNEDWGPTMQELEQHRAAAASTGPNNQHAQQQQPQHPQDIRHILMTQQQQQVIQQQAHLQQSSHPHPHPSSLAHPHQQQEPIRDHLTISYLRQHMHHEALAARMHQQQQKEVLAAMDRRRREQAQSAQLYSNQPYHATATAHHSTAPTSSSAATHSSALAAQQLRSYHPHAVHAATPASQATPVAAAIVIPATVVPAMEIKVRHQTKKVRTGLNSSVALVTPSPNPVTGQTYDENQQFIPHQPVVGVDSPEEKNAPTLSSSQPSSDASTPFWTPTGANASTAVTTTPETIPDSLFRMEEVLDDGLLPVTSPDNLQFFEPREDGSLMPMEESVSAAEWFERPLSPVQQPFIDGMYDQAKAEATVDTFLFGEPSAAAAAMALAPDRADADDYIHNYSSVLHHRGSTGTSPSNASSAASTVDTPNINSTAASTVVTPNCPPKESVTSGTTPPTDSSTIATAANEASCSSMFATAHDLNVQDISKKLLSNYLNSDTMQLLEKNLGEGKMSAQALVGHLSWISSTLVPDDQAEFMEKFANMSLNSGVLKPLLLDPAAVIEKEARQFEEHYRLTSGTIMGTPSDFANAAAKAALTSKDPVIIGKAGDQPVAMDTQRLGNFLRPFGPTLSPKDALPDDPDGIPRVRFSVLFSVQKDVAQRATAAHNNLKRKKLASQNSFEENCANPSPVPASKPLQTNKAASTNAADGADEVRTAATVANYASGPFTEAYRANGVPVQAAPLTSAIAAQLYSSVGVPSVDSVTRALYDPPRLHFQMHKRMVVNKAFEKMTGVTQREFAENSGNAMFSMKLVRKDHFISIHRVMHHHRLLGGKEICLHVVQINRQGEERYCILHAKQFLDSGFFLGGVNSLYLLPPECIPPPLVEGADVDPDVIRYGWDPVNKCAKKPPPGGATLENFLPSAAKTAHYATFAHVANQ